MTKITESAIENFAIELFEKLGYEYIYAPTIPASARLNLGGMCRR